MLQVFGFIWNAITGLVEMMARLVTGLIEAGEIMTAFGALGAFIIALLAVRVVKWVINR